MAGGRGRGRGRGTGKPNRSNESNNRRRGKSSRLSSSSAMNGALFVDGGILGDWSSTPNSSRGKNPGLNNNKSGSKSGSFDRTKPAFVPKNVVQKSFSDAFGYQYPSCGLQVTESHVESNNENNSLDELENIALVNSNGTRIFAYVDKTPSSRSPDVAFTYDYNSDFVLGESSHRGLGFTEELEGIPTCVEASSEQIEEEEEDPCFSSVLFESEMNAKLRNNHDVDVVTADETAVVKSSSKRNSGFLSFGGMKLFTEDITDEEGDEDGDRESVEEGSQSSELGSSESDDSDNTSDSDSDIDEDVVNDYVEGVGGCDNILKAKWLVEQELDDSDDDTSSSGSYDKTVKKLGGIVLQEASREYGMKNTPSRKKGNGTGRDSWSSVMDDYMFVKGTRKLSGKKKQVARFPQSWPLGAQKSKSYRNFPGEKKKHRKEMIAAKRRERMRRLGVDLEQISLKLEQIVLNGVDTYSFQPMHSRACSQVRRLAAIYRLRSGCQGSGKKGFVTVTRTQHTCMPSSSERIRLEKLIGAGEDADFSLVECSNSKTLSGDGRRSRKNANSELGQSAQQKASASRHKRSNDRQNGKRESFANQPVSFVSSGMMGSDTVEITTTDSNSESKCIAGSASFGAFEVHTKGFGSKMMAKMGYVEGEGLGKDCKGIAQPIEVIKRPKSLGLGMDFSNTIDDPATSDPPRSRPVKNKPPSLGSFEKHTKGFGSKMMAKMGFDEGAGLGKDSQGMVNPLVAVRLPKSRGLGAKG